MPDLLQARLQIAPTALFQDIEGEIVILCQDQYFSLTEVAAKIWTCIAERGDLNALTTALVDDYEIDAATVRLDVARLLDQFVDEGLVVIAT